MVRFVLLGVLAVGAGALVAYTWPDIRRYIKISRM
jgi:hypothetical protein